MQKREREKERRVDAHTTSSALSSLKISSLSLSLSLSLHVLNITTTSATSDPQLEMFRYIASASTSRHKTSRVKSTQTTGRTHNTTTTSQQLLQQITNSEHAPGIRRAGCPCCDPDAASNYADKMMMGGLT